METCHEETSKEVFRPKQTIQLSDRCTVFENNDCNIPMANLSLQSFRFQVLQNMKQSIVFSNTVIALRINDKSTPGGGMAAVLSKYLCTMWLFSQLC